MRKKTIPLLFKEKKECCGCTACYSICNNNAISMKRDEEGFLYPIIDESICVRCNMCVSICPMKSK